MRNRPENGSAKCTCPEPPLNCVADAEQIWRAGVAAVQPAPIDPRTRAVSMATLLHRWRRSDRPAASWPHRHRRRRQSGRRDGGRAGKRAWAAAARGEECRPAGSMCRPIASCQPQRVHLHAARPAGRQRAAAGGCRGTRRILELCRRSVRTTCASASSPAADRRCLPAPVPEISLDDKIRVTRLLSAAGANIEQLNTVRRHLSLVKGGGLARAAARAG